MTRRHLAGWLIVGALVRLVALPLAGTSDVALWAAWADLTTPTVSATYGVEPGEPTEFGYPPVAAFEFAAVNRVNRLLDPSGASRRVFNVLIKFLGVALEGTLCVALLLSARYWRGGTSERMALALWLSPAILLTGPILGYFDTQTGILAVFALWAATVNRPVAAGLMAVAAALTKPQGVLLVPAMALVIWHQGGPTRVRAAAAAGMVTVAALAPFAMRGTLGNIWPAIVGNLPDMASGQAANVWWVLSWWVQRAPDGVVNWVSADELAAMGYPAVTAIGFSLTGCALVWGLWRSRRVRTLEDGALVAAWCVHAWFTLSVGVHENHLALAVPPLIVAGLNISRQRLAVAVSLIATANMALFYGLGENGWREVGGYPQFAMPILAVAMLAVILWTAASLPRLARAGLAGVVITLAAAGWFGSMPHSLVGIRMAAGFDVTLLLAFVNLAVFAWHTRTLWRTTAVAIA